MRLSPGPRKLALTAHVTASVGWLGAVVAFLGLSVVGVTSDDATRVRAAYVAMEAIGWLVLVPLSLMSLLTGLVQALGTPWGLFRHYWVVIKLVMNLVASFILLLYMDTLEHLAGVAATAPDLTGLRDPSPIIHSAGALVLLLVAAVLSVYKPRGLTRYGRRRPRAAT